MKSFLLVSTIIACFGIWSCTKEKPVGQDEEIEIIGDYKTLLKGLWLATESLGRVQEDVFKQGDSLWVFPVPTGSDNKRKLRYSFSGTKGDFIYNFKCDIDVDNNTLSNIIVRYVPMTGEKPISKTLTETLKVIKLNDNELHLKMTYSDGVGWTVKMKKIPQ